MKDLRDLLTKQGFEHVQTYIQSGNCVFQAQESNRAVIEAQVAGVIEAAFGFRPSIIAMQSDALDVAIASNPYEVSEEDGKTVHFFFLLKPAPSVDIIALEALQAGTERFTLTDDVFYLHAPDGIGRSKLAAKAERLIGVPATGRNLRSVLKIRALAQSD